MKYTIRAPRKRGYRDEYVKPWKGRKPYLCEWDGREWILTNRVLPYGTVQRLSDTQLVIQAKSRKHALKLMQDAEPLPFFTGSREVMLIGNRQILN